MQDTEFSKTLRIENGKLIRSVDDIEETKKIIEIINQKGLMGSSIVNTTVYSEQEKLVEHDIIPFIIHSGEYTESMGYDVQKKALDMSLDFLNNGVYSWDLHPHNFTYHNGNWFLYDFGSFDLSPKNVITQIRGFFKITFSNLEILRYLTRKEMLNYYLTRIRICDILKLISLNRWLFLIVNMSICKFLLIFKQYKFAYVYLKNLFNFYTKNYKKEYYDYKLSETEIDTFNVIDKEVSNYSTAFCIGEEAAKWAIKNEEDNKDLKKFAYIDDYELCDKYYNYIYKKGYKKLSTAVLFPLTQFLEIPENNKYRALFDDYTKYRFISDVVISMDYDNIKVLKDFTTNSLIVTSNTDLTESLKQYFDEVYNVNNLYIAKWKKDINKPVLKRKYEDGNRGPDAHRQTWEIYKILKQKKHK